MVKKQSAIYLPISFHRRTFAGGNPRSSGRILHVRYRFSQSSLAKEVVMFWYVALSEVGITPFFEVLRRKAQKTEPTDSQIIHAVSPFLEPWG